MSDFTARNGQRVTAKCIKNLFSIADHHGVEGKGSKQRKALAAEWAAEESAKRARVE